MRHVYEGKTKSVYQLDNGNYYLKFKDDATGENGKFDPGANSVALTIQGLGRADLRLTEFFFRKIAEAGYPTHFISADWDNASMTVKPATVLGNGLEVICRFRAVGSFYRRYGQYCKEGQSLDAFIEITLKDDIRQDPPISKSALVMLGIVTDTEYDTLCKMTADISRLIQSELAQKDIELYDIKLEFGRIGGKIALIDEISGGNMRAYQNGRYIEPMELARLVTGS